MKEIPDMPDRPLEAAMFFKRKAIEVVEQGMPHDLATISQAAKDLIERTMGNPGLSNKALKIWARAEGGIAQFKREKVVRDALKTIRGL